MTLCDLIDQDMDRNRRAVVEARRLQGLKGEPSLRERDWSRQFGEDLPKKANCVKKGCVMFRTLCEVVGFVTILLAGVILLVAVCAGCDATYANEVFILS